MKTGPLGINLMFLLVLTLGSVDAQDSHDKTYPLLAISDKLSIKGLWSESIQLRKYLMVQNSSEQMQAVLLNRIGSDLRYCERYDEAQSVLEKALQLATKTNLQKERANALYLLADLAYIKWSYFRSDSVSKALALVNQSLEIYERINDPAGISQCLFRFGTILQIKGDGPGSAAVFKRSIKLSQEAKDTLGLTRSLTHLAADYGDRNILDSALFGHQQALSLAKSQHNNYGRAHYLNNTGEILLLLNRKEEALGNFQEALFISRELNQNLILCRSYYSLGEYYYKSGDRVKASHFLVEGLKCAQRAGYTNFIKAFTEALNRD